MSVFMAQEAKRRPPRKLSPSSPNVLGLSGFNYSNFLFGIDVSSAGCPSFWLPSMRQELKTFENITKEQRPAPDEGSFCSIARLLCP